MLKGCGVVPFVIPDFRFSAKEAIDRGVISGVLEHLADVDPELQEVQHQARVSALSVLNRVAGPDSIIDQPWRPVEWAPVADAPPLAPSGLVAVAGEGQVVLSWIASPESDVKGYKVFRSTSSPATGGTLIGEPTVPSWLDTDVTNGVEYFYQVKAVDYRNDSIASAEVTATPDEIDAVPAAPVGVTATPGNGQVVVTWTASPEPDVVSYKVYRHTASPATGGSVVGTPTAATYTDSSVSNGTQYFYQVVAVDASQDSPPSSVVSATPVAPSGWGDGKAFMTGRTNQTTPLVFSNQSNIVIEDLMFDGTSNTAFHVNTSSPSNAMVCIRLVNCTNVTIRNVDFRNVAQPIAIFGGSNITIEYTRTHGIIGPANRLNIQCGNFVQTVQAPSNVKILNNKIKATATITPYGSSYRRQTEDIISLFSANGAEVAYNEIDGDGWQSDSGTGIILGDGGGSNQWVHHNTLLNPGQVGLAIAGGTGGLVEDNVVYQKPGYAGANIGAYCNNYYPGQPFGNNTFRNNRIWYRRQDGSSNSWWNPGGAAVSGNNYTDTSINPADLEVVL